MQGFWILNLAANKPTKCSSEDLINIQCISKNNTPTNKMLHNTSMVSSISDL